MTMQGHGRVRPPAILGRDTLARLRGSPRLLLFDIDGTLAPLEQRPENARIPDNVGAALISLSSERDTHVGLVTGRSVADAQRFLPNVPAWLVGNHGAEVRTPSGEVRVNPAVIPYRDAVVRALESLHAVSARHAGTRVEDKTWTLSFHYRLADPAVTDTLQAAAERAATESGLRLLSGKKIFELRPPVAVDKGTAVVELATGLGAFAPGASVLFAGDDLTDEDAFMALARVAPHAVTIRVSDEKPEALQTAATLVVRDPAALGDFLCWLAGND